LPQVPLPILSEGRDSLVGPWSRPESILPLVEGPSGMLGSFEEMPLNGLSEQLFPLVRFQLVTPLELSATQVTGGSVAKFTRLARR